MGVRILRDPEQRRACMYDSVSEQAFGPVLVEPDDVDGDEFLEFLAAETCEDPRDVSLTQLESLYKRWSASRRQAAA